jgi:glycosyltransferase involved in cell wall biosynthesis
MKRGPGVTLIVNTYNQPEYLARVLAGVTRQTQLPEEVLLADDGSEEETRQVFARWSQKQSFRCEHVWQRNEGFRRARILNQAVARTRSEYVVFLDGDTIPHWEFVRDHSSAATAGRFVQGHRALIEQKAAEDFGKEGVARARLRALIKGQMTGWINAWHWPVPLKRMRADLRGIRGCNLGIWRTDLVLVNGYNEAFTGWGREDAELAARLMNCGIRRLDLRGWALCYHLWHPPSSRAGLPVNDQLLADTVQQSVKRCNVGLDQYQPLGAV